MSQELYEVVDDRILHAMEALDATETEVLQILEKDRKTLIAHARHEGRVVAHGEPATCAVDGEPIPCAVTKTLAEKYGVQGSFE